MRQFNLTILILFLTSTAVFAQEAEPTEEAATAEPAEEAATAEPAEEAADETEAQADGGGVENAVYRAPTLQWGTGLFRLVTADSNQVRSFNVGLMGEYFSASDVARQGDENTRFNGRFSLSYTATDFLEVFATLTGSGNENSYAEPVLVQSLGDLRLGAKGFYGVMDGLSVGGMLGLAMFNAQNRVGLDFGATSIDLRAMASYDLGATADIPMMLHLNLGGYIDNSPTLFSTSDGGILALQRVERFAHNVSDYHMFGIGFGVEAPLNYVTPFMEWNLGIPVGPDDLNDCDVAVPECPGDIGFKAFPNTLTLGLRGTPVAGMSLSLGADIGLTGEESTGLPAVPPYNIVFGMAYNFEPAGGEEEEAIPVEPQIVYVETPVEAPSEPMSWILGEVVAGEDEGAELVAGALVSYPGTELNDQVTNTETGRFRSYEFATGTEVEVLITHPDFEDRSFTRVLEEEGQWGVRIRLQPDLNLETLSGAITSESGEAITGTAFVRGGEVAHEVALGAETQEFSFDLEAGEYIVTVVSEGFVTEREAVSLEGDTALEISMTQASPEQAAFLYIDRIYLSGEKIRFEGDELSLISEELLDQVAALMDRNAGLKVQVVAHGDDSSTEESTLERAEIVIEYLTSFGIDVERFEAVGAGGVDPLVPNISARNRDRNNRVEFLVIE